MLINCAPIQNKNFLKEIFNELLNAKYGLALECSTLKTQSQAFPPHIYGPDLVERSPCSRKNVKPYPISLPLAH